MRVIGLIFVTILVYTVSFKCASESQQTSLAPTESALILIEYQNEWVDENGWLRRNLVEDQELFKSAITNSAQVLKSARAADLHIIHVTLSPDENYRIFGDAKFGLRAAIPAVKTWQGNSKLIHSDFKPAPGEHVIMERTGASAFAGSNLDSYLRNNKINRIFLTGFATHVCVESTLRQAHDLGYETVVVTDATGAFNKTQQNYFEKEVLHHFGHGITTKEFQTHLN